ncbi:VOC family protein [Synechococcus sp. PCC 7336]|uniref:VOC family protein n=1 Tax=Synechococcus sp. PCC 7336 TaxID=195250 RepID=UPI00034AFDB2|nr:VOC family protein [Synechococcus sp. PCC 7336]
MHFQYIYTRLNVENFQTCKAFYRDVLKLSIKFEDDMDEYVEFDAGSIRITLFNRKKLAGFITRDDSLNYDTHSARVVLSFQVGNMEEAIAYLRARDIAILNPPTSYPDRGFISTCFRDPDGNLIELEQMTDVSIV